MTQSAKRKPKLWDRHRCEDLEDHEDLLRVYIPSSFSLLAHHIKTCPYLATHDLHKFVQATCSRHSTKFQHQDLLPSYTYDTLPIYLGIH